MSTTVANHVIIDRELRKTRATLVEHWMAIEVTSNDGVFEYRNNHTKKAPNFDCTGILQYIW